MSEDKLPRGWKVVNLLQVVEKTSNVDPKQEFNSEFIYIDISSIDSSIFSIVDPKLISTENPPSRARQLVKSGDTIVSTVRPNLKRIARISSKFHGQIASTGFSILRPSKIINSDYLFYSVIRNEFTEALISLQRGASYPAVRNSDVSSQKIPLPPLPEQQRIVAKLDAVFGHLDSLREKLDRIPELLKNFRQQVLTQAVSGELTREWREGKDLGEWETKRLQDFSQSKLGKMLDQAKNKGELIDYLRNINVRWFEIDFNDLNQMRVEKSELHKYELEYGDILICEGGEPGRAAMWKNERNEIIFQKALHRVRLNDNVLPEYFLFNLFIDASTERLNDLFTGTTIKHLTGRSLAKYQINVPSIVEQNEIVKKVDVLFGLTDKIESQYQSLKAKIDQLPQAVLAKAFRGELVSQEVKEYVREIGELGMVAEEEMKTFEVSKTSKV